MTARSGFTVSNGATIATTWGNGVRDHIVPIGTTNDVSSEGQLASNTSTNKVVVHDGTSARTLVAYGEWDDWISSAGILQGTGAVTAYGVGSTARYTMIGRTVHWSLNAFVASVSAPVAGQPLILGAPVVADDINGYRGAGYFYDASAGIHYPCTVFGSGAATAMTLGSSTTALALGASGFTAAIAVNDAIILGGSYESAA